MSIIQSVSRFITNKDYILIDSSKRLSGCAEDFEIDLGRTFSNVKSITPLSIIFQHNIYNINQSNNKLTLLKQSLQICAVIEFGNYDIQSLISLINTIYKQQNIQFIYDKIKNKVRIVSLDEIPFVIDFTNSTICGFIGFQDKQIQNPQIEYTSDTLTNQCCIVNVMTNLTNQFYAGNQSNLLMTFLVSNSQFSTNIEVKPPIIEIVATRSFFDKIHIWLLDRNLQKINNNNSDWIMLLQINFLN